ncbi:C-type cyclin-like Fic1p [Purpureocillium lavendulum]|uniref:RNA polymerase II holoenzyme cyclin-like subunit n=1 Tax=Purpureocillium lavendulum TaxID=1247861 RepID=A0AB34FPL6_9HYPO|nr:C-type cyclin-like Fic1p [Purpureocillium lavendulum]
MARRDGSSGARPGAMSANYWESTQRRHWLFTKDQLASMRQKLEDDNADLVRMFPLPQPRHLSIYFNQQLLRLGKRLSIRQQAMATAQVYLKRFYSRVEIRRTNPYLVITTAIYLACKMEEAPQHIRLIVTEARQLWQEFIGLDTSKLGECEFYLISEMNSQLIVHQPYRTLSSLRGELSLVEEDVQLARSVINDHYMTDLPLLCAPHIIALVAILLALVLRPNTSTPGQGMSGSSAAAGLAAAHAALSQAQARANGLPDPPPQAADSKEKQQEARMLRVQQFAAWLAESGVDISAMVDATQEIISFYECHEQYNDKLTREQINRFVKARGLDKRHCNIGHLPTLGDGNLVSAADNVDVHAVFAQHRFRVLDPLLLDDNGILLREYQTHAAALQAGGDLVPGAAPPRELVAQPHPGLVVLAVDGGVPDRAHVRANEALVLRQLPLDDVADLDARPHLRRHGHLVKIDVDVGVLALGHVGARPAPRLQPAARQRGDEPARQDALRVEQAALEADVRGADQPAGADQGQGPEERGVVRREGGGERAAEGVAEEVEGGAAGPRERRRRQDEEDLGRVQALIVGDVEGSVRAAFLIRLTEQHDSASPFDKLLGHVAEGHAGRADAVHQQDLFTVLGPPFKHLDSAILGLDIAAAGEDIRGVPDDGDDDETAARADSRAREVLCFFGLGCSRSAGLSQRYSERHAAAVTTAASTARPEPNHVRRWTILGEEEEESQPSQCSFLALQSPLSVKRALQHQGLPLVECAAQAD